MIDMDAMNFDLPSSPFNDHNYYDRAEDFTSANIDVVLAGDELFTSDDLEAAFNGAEGPIGKMLRAQEREKG